MLFSSTTWKERFEYTLTITSFDQLGRVEIHGNADVEHAANTAHHVAVPGEIEVVLHGVTEHYNDSIEPALCRDIRKACIDNDPKPINQQNLFLKAERKLV